ncbi:hypothetical protein MBANPS3_011469, partial [Mucor bainieri]
KVAQNVEFEAYASSNDGDEFGEPPSLPFYDNKEDNSDIARTNKDIGLKFGNPVLTYWSRYASKYPMLSKFAAKCLGVSSTSVASERRFSQAKGFIKTERALLRPETAEKYVLLNCWYREIEQSS